MISVTRRLLLAVPLLVVAGCVGTGPRIERPDMPQARITAEAIARDALAQFAVVPTQTLVIEQSGRSGGGMSPTGDNDDDRIVGFDVWSRIAGCPIGWVVVNLDETGRTRDIYTRDGCTVAGLSSY